MHECLLSTKTDFFLHDSYKLYVTAYPILLGPQRLTEVRPSITYHIHYFLWYTITNPCRNFNGGLDKKKSSIYRLMLPTNSFFFKQPIENAYYLDVLFVSLYYHVFIIPYWCYSNALLFLRYIRKPGQEQTTFQLQYIISSIYNHGRPTIYLKVIFVVVILTSRPGSLYWG